ALSNVAFAHDKKYTSLVVVDDMYRQILGGRASDGQLVNAAIAQIVEQRPTDPAGRYRLMGPDDKGMADFVAIAFRLFGLEVQSAFYLYFLILLISCCCFVFSFARSPSCLLLVM